MHSFLTSPNFIWLFLGFFVVPILLLGGFLFFLVITRSQGDMGLTKKANRFKDLEGFVNENGKKAYRQNEALRDLYYVARRSGARKNFVKGLVVAGERGGLSASDLEGARWLAQAIALQPDQASFYFTLGKNCLKLGKERDDDRLLRVAHQAFTRAFLLERGHVGAFEHLIMMSQMEDRIYGRIGEKVDESVAAMRASRQPGEP
jgi:hypothetical protein